MAEICTSATKNRWGWGASLLVMSMALGAGAGVANAQTAPAPSEDETIVVTGFRGSLAASLNVKRNATGFVDAITAEDIAKFPDANLAEAIQRIPGVAIDRDAGEGRTITVRGLGQDFTRVRINGMEGLSTTGGTDSSGGANRGRGFDFNVFASELFSGIRVTKSASASTEEGSLGATVDLRASHPFDFRGFHMAASGQVGYNDLSNATDPRAAFLISNTWADGKFGALFSAAYSHRSLFEEGFSTVRWTNTRPGGQSNAPPSATCSGVTTAQDCWDTTVGNGANIDNGTNWEDTSDGGVQAAMDVMNAAGTFFPRIPRYGRLTHDQDRLGLTAALQWRPWESTEVTFDYLYSNFDANREEDFLENFGFSRTTAAGGLGNIDVVSASVGPDGSLTNGTFNDVWIRTEARRDHIYTIFQQYVLTATHDFSDRFRMTARYGSALSDNKNPVQTTFFVDAFVSGYNIDFRQNANLPNISFGNTTRSAAYNALGNPGVPFDPTSAAMWMWRSAGSAAPFNTTPTAEIRLRPQGAQNWFRTAQLDFEFDINDNISLKAGYNWKRFEFDSFENRRFLPGTQTNNEFSVPTNAQVAAIGGVAGITNLLTGFGDGLDLGPNVARSWVRPDFDKLASAFDIYCNCVNAFSDFRVTPLLTAARSVRESDSGAYVEADWHADLNGIRFRGDIGARFVETKIHTFGFIGTTPVSVDNSYDDVLPALNVVAELSDDLQVRFAANKAMARPPLPNLSPGGSVDTANNSASVGNTLLDPYRSTDYDVGIEWYFAPEALLSVSYFYKDIESYIQNTRRAAPFGDTGLPDSLLAGSGDTLATSYTITQFRNTPGGTLSGFEVTYQQPFTFLPGPFANFGTILNYTNVESDIQYITNVATGATTTGRLVNLSPTSYNATLYYEDDHFEARVSVAYRDEYYLGGSIVNVPAQNNNFYVGKDPTTNVDASASWNVNERLSFTFDGINLTDEANSQFVADQNRTRHDVYVYHHTGRQAYFGFRFKY